MIFTWTFYRWGYTFTVRLTVKKNSRHSAK